MSYGSFDLNKVQFGREATAGTAVDSTEIWRGAFASLEDARERKQAEEQTGRLVSSGRKYDVWEMGRLSLPDTPLTFEQFPHLMEMGFEAVTPTGSDPYTYTYEYPFDGSVLTPKSYTVEAYNVAETDDFRELHYAIAEEISISGSAASEWMMAATIMGQKLFTGTPTSLTTLIDVEEALVPMTSLYIDATGGTIGTTQVEGVFMGGSIRIATGLAPVRVGDGTLYYARVKRHKPEITFTLNLELESDTGVVAAERAIFEANAYRLIRLQIAGSASRDITIDMAARYDPPGAYTNSDGNTVVTLNGTAEYSPTDALFFSLAVTNLRATL